MAKEETVFHVLDLPEGRDWMWFEDANMAGLSRRLNDAERERLQCELRATGPRTRLRVA